MKVTKNLNLKKFSAWSGGEITKEIIINNDKQTEFEDLIEDIYPDGLTDTQLNDLLWFNSDWLFEVLGIEEEE